MILDKQNVDTIEHFIYEYSHGELLEMSLHLIETLRAAWNERDDYKAILQEIRDGSDSPQYIASCILARYEWR